MTNHAAATDPTPYARLTPERVLDAVESLGLAVDGRLLALNSYENRVYQVGLEDADPVVAKFYRAGRWTDAQILEEHAFAQALADADIPLVPPLVYAGRTLHRYEDLRFSMTPRRGGRAPELDNAEVLRRLGRLLGRLHNVGAAAPFRHRPALTIRHFGEEAGAYLLDAGWIPPELEPAYRSVLEQALVEVHACFERAGAVAQLRLHGDCHAGNILWTDAGAHFVDLDDARTGAAIQDLWMLLAGSREEMTAQLGAVLAGYREFREFDPRELHLLEALRTLRQIHYAAWLARRWQDPAFPAAFPWFDEPRFWQDQVLALREQIAAMQEGPLPMPPAY
ncbi:MAG: serine/threonine protein kinase [Thiohalocapsa sp.]|jgi:Ser/Thr protein kinase RdoA (MazF antagonist)|uniref:serine/threonine protein kinase n=1 Tax=Thiohalocapsa sp. TaxID=2497641 RepID=UPI0025D080AA|nr:serine/threonine protein kinase [Thiohalocapsa sp.]MCG6940038.1 serine/threonine protein kinase [Thiohalocapsa sp.]